MKKFLEWLWAMMACWGLFWAVHTVWTGNPYVFHTPGACQRCGVVPERLHDTGFDHTFTSLDGSQVWARGILVLCDPCWSKLTIDERLAVYNKTMTRFGGWTPDKIAQVQEAVRAGR
jgi:hypothetical protein